MSGYIRKFPNISYSYGTPYRNQNKACWEIRPQKDFANRVDFSIEEFDLPEWTDSWDENWYDDQEWYDDGGWNGEFYENDEEYYAEDEFLTGEGDE